MTIDTVPISRTKPIITDRETLNIFTGSCLVLTPSKTCFYHKSDSASSTTKSAPLTVRDKVNQQDKIEQQQLINDIAAQMKDVANKYDRIQAQNEVDKHPELVDKAAKEAYDKLSAEEKAKTSLADFTAANKDSLYYTAVDTQVKNSKENIGGIGSSVDKGIDAATSVITGILTGNIVGGLAGAGAPYIAEQIKLHTGHQESDGSWKMDDPNANLIAHAILGGVVAQLQGNSALAGATGAAGSEKIADIIREQLYDNRPVKDLTESEKQNISNLTQLATGLATALASGGDMGDTGAAVNAGKNAVENNSLAGDYIREEHKGSIEYWKDQVRETVGENTISQITNGVLTAYGDTVDLGVGVADTALDAVLAFSSCTMGASYCDTAMKDLQGANQTAYDAMWALSSGQAWDSLVNTFAKAQQGDQKALEEVAGILSSVLVPSKIVAGNTGKTGSLGNKVENIVSDTANAGKGTAGTTSNGYKVSNGSDKAIAKADLEHPVVQSRINVKTGDTDSGWVHVQNRHFSGKTNASQFTISETEAKAILNSSDTAKIPISSTRSSYNKVTGQTDTIYERVITLDKNIGIDKFSGKPTNTMTVLTDKKGNLVTVTPGRIK